MTLINKDAGTVGGGPAVPDDPVCTIFEVIYPDDRRRASGEPGDEAVSRCLFLTLEEGAAFRYRNGGTLSEKVISVNQRKHLVSVGLLPRRNSSKQGIPGFRRRRDGTRR